MRKTRILIVEDDATLSEQITQLLQSRGFDTRHESDGNAGLQAVLEENFDLVLLDIRLPSLNGLSLLNQLRQIKQTPVMMITASGAEQERIEGYRKGADDYLPKPFNFTEMMLRIDALLRRSKTLNDSGTQKSEIIVDVLYLNRIQQVTKYHSRLLEFTPIQFKLLWMLVDNKGETLSKAFLYHSVLNKPFSRYDLSLDMHLSRVRKKLVETGMPPERLATVHGQGYRFS
ncbi:MAG: response regulator transcription factor [Pseudomonadota bacterium]|nr:response regulator transcription factor [Pseudomonadota bacterium]